MPFAQFLSAKSIYLDYDPSMLYPTEDETCNPRELRRRIHESVLTKIAELLNASGRIGNWHQLLSALLYNDRQVSSAIGENIAIPHVRCMQVRSLRMAFLRCPQGVDFDAIDKEKVHIFIAMVAPNYDDSLYLRVYKRIAEGFLNPTLHAKQRFMQAKQPGEIIRIMDECFGGGPIGEHEEWEHTEDESLSTGPR